MVWSVVLFLGVVFSANALIRPDYIIPCARSHGFDECALKNARHAIPFIVNGDKNLKIPNMNPLRIPLVDLKGTNQFHLKISNLEVYGLDRVEVLGISADFDKLRLDVNSTVDELLIVGDYEINGKILMFPLTGEGRLNMTLNNGLYQYGVNWVVEVRDGREYTKITDSSYDYKLKNMTIDLQNLFNGDKMLGDQMNKFLNENWEILNDDLKAAFVETLLALHTDIATKLFSKIPMDELFLD